MNSSWYKLVSTYTQRQASRSPYKPCIHNMASPQISSETKHSQTVELSDGRLLGFAEYGSPTGKPLLWCHGFPGSRIEVADWEPLLNRLDIRFIGIDRPGFGLSTFQPDRKLLDWPQDVLQLTKHLNMNQFHVMGGSGGGPYVIACANAFPRETLLGVAVIAGAGPPESGTKGMAWIGKMFHWISGWPSVVTLTRKAVDWYVMPAVRDPDPEVFRRGFDKIVAAMTERDRAIFDNKIFLEVAIEAMREAFRQGATGTAEDSKILGLPWGFKLEDIDCNKVKLYYGTEDINTPVSQGRYMAQHIKNATLKEYPGETHFTILAGFEEEILKDFFDID